MDRDPPSRQGRPDDPPPWDPFEKAGGWILLLLPVVLAAAAFSPSLGNGFVWDDHHIVVPVEAYRNFDWVRIFTSRANGLEYLPVRDISFAIDMWIWGDAPFGFHLTNVVLYLVSLPLVYATTRDLARLCHEREASLIAFLSTLIFALHPLHAEPVNLVAARNTLLALLFGLLVLFLFVRGSKAGSRLVWATIPVFGLALLSKASIVFLPLFLLALALLVFDAPERRRRAVAVSCCLLTIDLVAIAGHLVVAESSGSVQTGLWRFGNESFFWVVVKAAQIPFFYLEKFLLPHSLSVYYPETLLLGNAAARAAASALALSGAALIVWRARHRSRFPLLGFLWFLLALAPVSNLISTYPVVADRYAYPCVLGLGMICAWLVAATSHRRGWAYGICALIAVGWLTLDVRRSLDWRSDRTLFASAYAVDPQSACIAYAHALAEAGEIEQAMAVLEETRPSHFLRPLLLGNEALERGDLAPAVAYLEEAKNRGGGGDKGVLVSLASAYERSGRSMQALQAYLSVSEADSVDPLGRNRQGAEAGIERLRGRLRPRMSALEAHARANPRDPRAQSDLAMLLHTTGNYAGAVRSYERAIAIDSSPWALWYNLGLSHTRLRSYDRAIAAYAKALERHPRHAPLLNDLGVVHALSGRRDAAIDYYTRALNTDSRFVDPAFNLGRLYFRRGEEERARHFLRLARERASAQPALLEQIDHAISNLP